MISLAGVAYRVGEIVPTIVIVGCESTGVVEDGHLPERLLTDWGHARSTDSPALCSRGYK